MLRQQLPVYSPLTLGGLVSSTRDVLTSNESAVRRLEQVLNDVYRAEVARIVGSGTQALLLAIQTACRSTGSRQVALPGFSCYDVASAAVAADASIALYDLDPRTLSPDLASLERELIAGVRVVVVSPLYGIPVTWEAIADLCRAYGAVLIEDAAQGHGARWRGAPLGSLGEISVISFGRGKGWSGGGGGAALFRGMHAQAVQPTIRSSNDSFGILARAVAQWALGRPSTYWIPAALPSLGLGETRYHDTPPPAAAPDLVAAIVLRTRTEADQEASLRRLNAETLLNRLSGTAAEPVMPPADGEGGYLRLPIRLPYGNQGFPDSTRARNLGIMASYPSTLSALPQVSPRLRSATREWPGSVELVRTLMTIPTHSCVTEADLAATVSIIASYPLHRPAGRGAPSRSG